jgi:hypothetical protein
MESTKKMFALVSVFSLCLFTILLLPVSSWAVCPAKVGTTLTAVDASYAEVSSCVTASTYGDTIIIPASASCGTPCTWGSRLIITKGVTIRGAGISSTVISSAQVAIISYIPDATSVTNNQKFEISDMTLDGLTLTYATQNTGIYIQSNTATPAISNIIVHDIKFTQTINALYLSGQIYGVAYSNQFVDCPIILRAMGNNCASWTNHPASYASANNFFLEDNQISFVNYVGSAGSGWIEGGHGGRYLLRYNTWDLTNSVMDEFWDMHGNQPGSLNATMIAEFYGNQHINATAPKRWLAQRGGQALMFNNVYTGTVGTPWIHLYEEYTDDLDPACTGFTQHPNNSYFWNNRNNVSGTLALTMNDLKYSGTHTGPSNSANLVDSAAPFNANQEVNYWVFNVTDGSKCKITANTSTTLTCTLTGGTDNDWDIGDNYTVEDDCCQAIALNSEYFADNPTSGSAGISCGTLGAIPTTCTVGHGYWATDQSCSNLMGMVGANPSTPISGTLYKCTATNTWTAYYTPYSYPHPLHCATSPYPETPLCPKPVVSVTPTTIPFGSATIGGSPISSGSITVSADANHGYLKVSSLNLSGAGDFSKLNDACTGQIIAPSGSCIFQALFTPALPEGAKAATITVATNDDVTPAPTIALTGTAVYVATTQISVSPRNIAFMGAAPSKEQKVTVSNNGSINLNISAITKGGDNPGSFTIQNDTCTTGPVLPSGSCTFEIYLSSAAANQSATVTITSNADNPSTVTLTGNGTVTATPSSTNSNITEYAVSDSITNAPTGYNIQNVVSFKATGLPISGMATVSITYTSLPASPKFYKVVNGVWKEIWEANECTGSISDRAFDPALKKFTYTITDNSACDSDLTVGIIYDPVVVGSVASGSANSGGGGGCFIATAAYGSSLDPHINVLRDFRDRYLLTNSLGQAFVSGYYRYSPPVAAFIEKHETVKTAARWALAPVVYCIEYPYLNLIFLVIPAGIVLVVRRRNGKKVH